MRPQKVAIVGCGTAGPATALLLSRAGHAVTLFERVEHPGPVGAGIVLQPSGMSVLARLGLLEPVLAKGARLDELYAETSTRKRVVHLRYQDLAPGLYGLGLHRGVLFETLFEAVKASPTIDLKLGVELQRVERRDGTVHLTAANGDAHGPFDLVVVCDGARSRLHDDRMPERRSTKYPWGALWFVARGVTGVPRRLYQVVRGTRRLLGLLPTGQAPGSTEPVVSLFWSIRLSEVDAFRSGDFGAWKREVLEYMSEAAPVLEQLRGPSDLLVSEYHDVVMPRWHTDRVVWLGDAAHATSPQLGQGCNLALIDSAVLADCLEDHDVLSDALHGYTRRRRAHLGYYQFATRWLTPFFQSDLAWLGPIRDALFGFTTTLGPFRRQMLLGMAGIHRGWSAPMQLPALPAELDA